jgi:hypothetical protein
MVSIVKKYFAVLALLVGFAFPAFAQGATLNASNSVSLSFTVGESLSVSAAQGSYVLSNSAYTDIVITTSQNISSGHTSGAMDAYFGGTGGTGPALSGPVAINTTALFVKVNGVSGVCTMHDGTSFVTAYENVCKAASLPTATLPTTTGISTTTTTVSLQINGNFQAGTYNGTLNLVAQIQ